MVVVDEVGGSTKRALTTTRPTSNETKRKYYLYNNNKIINLLPLRKAHVVPKTYMLAGVEAAKSAPHYLGAELRADLELLPPPTEGATAATSSACVT